MSLKSFVKLALQRPANMLVSSSSIIPAKVKDSIQALIMEEPAIAAKFLPYQGGKVDYILDRIQEHATSGNTGLPVPPVDLWQAYGRSIENFLATGKSNVGTMRDMVAQSDFPIEAGYPISIWL